jgi:hypothetical protein
MSIVPSDQRRVTFVDYVLEKDVSEKVKVSPIMWAEAEYTREEGKKALKAMSASFSISKLINSGLNSSSLLFIYP